MSCVPKRTTLRLGLLFILAIASWGLCSPEAFAYIEYGIIDRDGRTIVPCKYRIIEYLGHGNFFLEEINDEHPLKPSYKGKVVDRDGKPLTLNVPDGFTLSNVYPPASSDKDDLPKSSLPADTILQIHGKEGVGLCRLDGSIILEPKYEYIGAPIRGFLHVSSLPLSKRTPIFFIFNSKTGKRLEISGLTAMPNFASEPPFPFEVHRDGKSIWGYIDLDGTILIEPKYSSAGEFMADGLARVCSQNVRDHFYIDKAGNKVAAPPYRHVENFKDSCLVMVNEGTRLKYGLIDKNGKYTIEPEYTQLKKLSDNLFAGRKTENDQFKAITSDGKELFTFPPLTQRVHWLSDGLIACIVKTGTEEKQVCIDADGKILRVGKNAQVLFLPHGIACEITKGENQRSYWKLLDKNDVPIQPSQRCLYKSVSADRILRMTFNDSFKTALWKEPSPIPQWGFNRTEQFSSLVHDFDLIGMPKAQIEKLLGPSERGTKDGISYWLGYPGCFHSYSALEIQCNHLKVTRWRVIWNPGDSRERATPWITQNMLVQYSDGTKEKSADEPPFRFIEKPKG